MVHLERRKYPNLNSSEKKGDNILFINKIKVSKEVPRKKKYENFRLKYYASFGSLREKALASFTSVPKFNIDVTAKATILAGIGCVLHNASR